MEKQLYEKKRKNEKKTKLDSVIFKHDKQYTNK